MSVFTGLSLATLGHTGGAGDTLPFGFSISTFGLIAAPGAAPAPIGTGINYVGLAETAQRLIQKNGRDVALIKRSRTAADVSKPWRGNEETQTTVTVKGVLSDYNMDEVDGENIRRGDRRLLIAALDATQEIRDYDGVQFGGEFYDIQDVNLVEPSTTRIIWVLQLRQ